MRILIANPFGIGDVLFSLPLIHAIREADPNGTLGFLCNRRTEDLVAAPGLVDRCLVFEKDEFKTAWRRSKRQALQLLIDLHRAIREGRFDACVDLSLGWHYGLGAFLAGIPKRVGFNFRDRGRFLTRSIPMEGFHDRPVAEYYLDLLPLLGFPKPARIHFSYDLPEGIVADVEAYLESRGLSFKDRLLGIVPGGGASWGPNARFKQWAPERFAEVADEIGARLKAQVLLIGDSREAPLCQEVAGSMKRRSILTVGVPSLPLLAGVLKRCDLVIGNDGGLMHLAASVGTQTVSIFGPVDGSVYGPFVRKGEFHRVVAKGLACRPCYQGFRFPPCPWDNACLKHLEVSQVLEVVG